MNRWASSILVVLYMILGYNNASAQLCQHADKPLKKMYQAVLNSETPKVWKSYYQKAQQARVTLQKRQQWQQQDEGCLLAIQSEAAFYLSAQSGVNDLLWKVRALGALTLTQAWYPKLAQQARWKTRWKTVRQRVSYTLKKLRKKNKQSSAFWIADRGQTWVQIPSLRRPVTLILSPPVEQQWSQLCGLSKVCQDPLQWRLEIPAGTSKSLYLPVGHYKVKWTGACAKSESQMKIDTKTSSFTAPQLNCYSSIQIIDQYSNLPIKKARIEKILAQKDPEVIQYEQAHSISLQAMSLVHIKAPGYHAQQVQVPQDGTPLKILLHRCSVPISWQLNPTTIQTKLPQSLLWGVPHTFTMKAMGYQSQKYQFKVPRPASCQTQPFPFYIRLAREVSLFTQNQLGVKIDVDQLELAGVMINPQQKVFYRPPGRYKVRAFTKGYQPISSSYQIDECNPAHTDYKRKCLTQQLLLQFKKPAAKISYTAQNLKVIGALLLGSGIVLSAYGYMTFDRHPRLVGVENYNAINQEVQQWSYATSSLLLTGVLSYTLGLLWPALSTEK